jgi:peptidyl-prolyl cis-trans isomerase C
MKRFIVRTWLALVLASTLVVCVAATASADDAVVAKINGVDIKQSDLDFATSEIGPQLANFPPEDRRRMLLQFVMENELMAEAAVQEGLDRGPSFEDRLKYHKRRALRDAYFDQSERNAVSEEEAKKIYDAKVADIKPEEEIHARHILVATEAEAKEVKERLMKGEDFATVAKEKSKDPSAEGGDLGFFGRGKMLKPFEDAAFALKDGEISDPVQTQFGWHIIKVEERRTHPLPTFDQVKDTIMSQLSEQKANQKLKELHEAAKIEIIDPDIKKSMDAAAAKNLVPSDQPEQGSESGIPPG